MNADTEQRYPAFLGAAAAPSAVDALVHILPFPLEASVSYGHGTRRGPEALLWASHQVELFDGHATPYTAGIYTHPPIACDGVSVDELLVLAAEATSAIARGGHVPVMLGGEHTATLGPVRGLQKTSPPFGVVQFDAHADLRDTYGNNPLSHACVMRRIFEQGIPIMQLGVRSLSEPEAVLRRDEQIPHLDAETLWRDGTPTRLLPDDFPRDIYITFDIDAFDPSLVPATGTPEPGGLSWYQALDLLRAIARGRRVIGADIVELAPVDGWPASDFVAAKLTYAIAGLILESQD